MRRHGSRDEIVGLLTGDNDDLLSCLLPALRSAAALDPGRAMSQPSTLSPGTAASRLAVRLARPARAADEWSLTPPSGCSCELCATLATFLRDPARRAYDWSLAEAGRKHVHHAIDAAELPVRDQTRRQGRPYTLVLTKTDELFAGERQ